MDKLKELLAKQMGKSPITNVDLVPGKDSLDNLLCEKWTQIEKTAPIVDIIKRIETGYTSSKEEPKCGYTLLLKQLDEYVDGYESSVSTCRTSARDREPAAASEIIDSGRHDPEKQSITNRVVEIKGIRDDLKLKLDVVSVSDEDTVAIKENIDKIKSVLGEPESNSNHQEKTIVTFGEDWIRSAVDDIDDIDKEPDVKENITDVVSEKQKKPSEVSKRGTRMDRATTYKKSAVTYLNKFLPSAETKEKERIPKLKFTGVSGVVTTEIKNRVVRLEYNDEQFKILQRAICMSDEFSRAESFNHQVSLFRKFEEWGWLIKPEDMDLFFQEEKEKPKKDDATVISTFVKAGHDLKNWKVLLDEKPNIRFKMDPNVKVFFEMDTHIEGGPTLTAPDGTIKQFPKRIWQTASYSTKIHGPMLHMALQSNRLRVIIDSILFSKGNAKTVDGCFDEKSLATVVPAERKGKDPDEETDEDPDEETDEDPDEETDEDPDEDPDYLTPGIVDDSQKTGYSELTDWTEWPDSQQSFDGTAAGGEDDNDNHHEGKKSTSRKGGGFIKGILKNMSTCGCNKKTRRRNGKKFTVRKRKGKGKGHGKGKKIGGKRTIRKKLKTGGVKDRRVRFTVKN